MTLTEPPQAPGRDEVGHSVAPPRRRPWLPWIVGLLVVALLGGGVWLLVYRQTLRPLSLGQDDNAIGAIHRVNTRLYQTGQWYAPWTPSSFTVAYTFYNSSRWAVHLDAVRANGLNAPEGQVTYNTPMSYSQEVAPAADRQPLHHTAIPAHGSLTVDVPYRYACRPRDGRGGYSTVVAMAVTWDLWGEHHTQWMTLPMPIIETGGAICRSIAQAELRALGGGA